jgi:hypothetical protein
METGLNYDSEEFTEEEKEHLLDRYRSAHGTVDLDLSLVRFAPFLIEFLPAAFKRMRRTGTAGMQPREGEDVALPGVTYALLNTHSYTAIAYGDGVVYEYIAARYQGASKALVLDILNYAYISAGPRGMNAAAEGHQYLKEWVDEANPKPIPWPEGWAPNPAIFQAGLDYVNPDLTPEEVQRLSEWHQRMNGVVPRHVELFSRLHPRAYKLLRLRYEKAIGNVIPAQLVPLCTLHLATMENDTQVMRQAVHQARYLGVKRHHVFQTVFAGIRQLHVNPMGLEAATAAVHDLLAGWEE